MSIRCVDYVGVISGCTILAGTKYTNRYNRMYTYIHWYILNKLGKNTCTDWYKHLPEQSFECGDITGMWNMTLLTDKHKTTNRPNINLNDQKNVKLYSLTSLHPMTSKF